MSIGRKFKILTLTTSVVIGALILLILLAIANQRQLNRAQANRYESYRLAVELRQTSDELTRLVRRGARVPGPCRGPTRPKAEAGRTHGRAPEAHGRGRDVASGAG